MELPGVWCGLEEQVPSGQIMNQQYQVWYTPHSQIHTDVNLDPILQKNVQSNVLRP